MSGAKVREGELRREEALGGDGVKREELEGFFVKGFGVLMAEEDLFAWAGFMGEVDETKCGGETDLKKWVAVI